MKVHISIEKSVLFCRQSSENPPKSGISAFSQQKNAVTLTFSAGGGIFKVVGLARAAIPASQTRLCCCRVGRFFYEHS